MLDTAAPAAAAETMEFGPLGSSIGFLVRIAQLKIFENFYEEVGSHGLKPGEFSVLWILYRNPGLRQGVLAQRLLIKRAHMTKLVRGFELRGFVSRRIPDDDRRAVELTLTAAGRRFVESHRDAFFAIARRPLQRLTVAEQDQLRMLLQRLVGIGPGEPA
jgi:DNA-binding MarR family transcriptional regulator